MKPSILGPALLLSLITACASSPTPDASTVQSPQTTAVTPPPSGEAKARPAEPPKPREPTPEEKKKAEALRELQEDRAKMEASHKAEMARWTPELRAEAKALADKTFPTGKAAVQAAMAGKHRTAGHADRDKQRHPVETLDFVGFKPTMTVLEYGPGEGWYTELLAPALAKKGKLLVTNTDPNGPADERSTFYGQRFKLFLDKSPELYSKIETIQIDSKSPKLGLEGVVDMVLLFREMHGMVNDGLLESWLSEMHKSLKPNGVLGIEQHRAKADAAAEESSKKGYLPEKWVIERVEAAGFKLAGKSEVNANPKDTKDYPEGVWTLPPTYRLGDKDREKYTAIGESDRMTLKFVKVAKPDKAAAPTKPDAKPAAKPKPAKK
jgi:predicted methyltransferase